MNPQAVNLKSYEARLETAITDYTRYLQHRISRSNYLDENMNQRGLPLFYGCFSCRRLDELVFVCLSDEERIK